MRFRQDGIDALRSTARRWVEQRAEFGEPEPKIFVFDTDGLVWG